MPISETPIDEEKDPNYIAGRNHLNMMDYKGAVEAFERAVQANPRNAAAHFELGVLYQDRLRDWLSAAYHYQKHLELRPKSEYAEPIKPRLVACKMEVAKTVTFGIVNQEVHRDLARLTNELALARQQNETLRMQLAAKPTVVTQWMKFTVTNNVQVPVYLPMTNAVQRAANPATDLPPPQPRHSATNTIARVTPLPASGTTTTRRIEQRASSNVPQTRTSPATRQRTHVVRSGDTMSNIARRYGVSLQRLQASNPSVNARQLRAGQTVNIPSQ